MLLKPSVEIKNKIWIILRFPISTFLEIIMENMYTAMRRIGLLHPCDVIDINKTECSENGLL